jgi:hypothetical protein
MHSGLEIRLAPASAGKLTVAPAKGGDGYRIGGYIARFDSETYISAGGRGFTEVIRRGAFARTLRERPDIRLLHSHDPRWVLGRTKSGTLALAEDQDGLRFSALLAPTAIGRDVAESIRRGDVDGASFGFTVANGGDRWTNLRGKSLRELLDIDLHEASVVAFPAYPETEVGMSGDDPGRSMDRDDINRRLREREILLFGDKPQRKIWDAATVATNLRRREALLRKRP